MSPTEDPESITARVETVDGTTSVVVMGEIDLSTAPLVEAAVAQASTALRDRAQDADAGAPETLLVDMSGVSFCDSHGLSALLRSEAAATGHGVPVRLRVVPGSLVARALERSGLSQVLSLEHAAGGS